MLKKVELLPLTMGLLLHNTELKKEMQSIDLLLLPQQPTKKKGYLSIAKDYFDHKGKQTIVTGASTGTRDAVNKRR